MRADRTSLRRFLERFPWEPAFAAPGSPRLDFLFEFELDAEPAELWPYLVDTSSFNKRLKLPEFSYEEIGGRLMGKTKYLGVDTAWEELPWEWEYLKGLNNARIYSSGFGKLVRSRYLVEGLGGGKTRVLVYFGWIPRGLVGSLLLHIGTANTGKGYEAALADIVREIAAARGAKAPEKLTFLARPRLPLVPGPAMEGARQGLVQAGVRPELVDALFGYVAASDEGALYRIRVKPLARRLGVAEAELLRAFLLGCRLGSFILTWDVICPHCRGVRTEAKHLGDLPPKDSCEACAIDFDATGTDSIEVTFHVHPSLREVKRRIYCAAEPATKSHILLQKRLAPAAVFESHMPLGAGVFRMRLKGSKSHSLLRVAEMPGDGLAVHWKASNLPGEATTGAPPHLLLENDTASPAVFVLEERSEDRDALRPADLFGFQDFRDIFSKEALATDLHLDIGVQTILFTDIVGSTRFYYTDGDAGAFSEVRKHFISVYDEVKSGGGAIIKTIGDSVMAAFPTPRQALLAAIGIQGRFEGGAGDPGESRLRVRITLNTGPCMAVNLDSAIDYFGNTVNFAAKLQSLSGAGDIVFSGAILRDREVDALIREGGHELFKANFRMDWAKETAVVYRISLAGDGAKAGEG